MKRSNHEHEHEEIQLQTLCPVGGDCLSVHCLPRLLVLRWPLCFIIPLLMHVLVLLLQRLVTMVLGINTIRDLIQGEPTLPPGLMCLPKYFPLEPHGCKQHTQKLFSCLVNEAMEKARDLEKVGLYESIFPDVEVPKPDKIPKSERLPKPGENPLDKCKTFIAYYQRCCEQEFRKSRNAMLTELYCVQEEYRYEGPGASGSSR